MVLPFIYNQKNKKDNKITIYINDGTGYVEQKLTNIPEGYVIDVKETNNHCTDATFTWDDETDTGGISTTKKISCKLYLKRKYIVVNLNTNGGEVSLSTKSILHDTAYTDLPTPTKSGYSFEGWYINGTKVTNEIVADSPNDVTLTANWLDDVAPTLSLEKITYKEGFDSCYDLTNAYINTSNYLIIGEDGNNGEVYCDYVVNHEPFEITLFNKYNIQ